MSFHFIDSAYFTVLYPALLIASIFTGYYIARRVYIRKGRQWKASGIESSVIGIFALLLSFTFLSSNNSMKARLDLVQNTADAAANLRRQSLFVQPDMKDTTRIYLIAYFKLMEKFEEHYTSAEAVLVKEIESTNGNYLSYLVNSSKKDTESRQQALMLLPLFNALNNHFYQIVSTYDIRTPHLIITLLLTSSLLIGMLVGFLNGFHTSPHYLVPVIFVVLVALCVQAIRDLDNPYSGSIQPSFKSFTIQKQGLINSKR